MARSVTYAFMLLSLKLIGLVLSQSFNCSTNGEVRLVNGSKMEGRVELCFRGRWTRVCGVEPWNTLNKRVVCRQLGFLDRLQPGSVSRAPFGRGTCVQNPTTIHNVSCKDFEERMIECSYQLQTLSVVGRNNNCCAADAVVQCMEGVPPTNLELHSEGGTNVSLNWDPPNSTIIRHYGRLTLVGYIITCRSKTSRHTVQVIADTVTNAMVTGLRLTEFAYECCVSADYDNYYPKECLTVNRTASITAANIPSTIIKTARTGDVTTTYEGTTPTTSATSTALGSGSGTPLLSVVCGILGAAVVILLVFSVAVIVYNVKQKPKRRKTSVVDNPLYLKQLPCNQLQERKEIMEDSISVLSLDSQPHTYEIVDKHYATAKTLDHDSSEMQHTPDGENPFALSHYEYSQIPDQTAEAAAAGHEFPGTAELSSCMEYLPAKNEKQLENDQYRLVEVPVLKTSTALGYDASSTDREPAGDLQPMTNGQYEFARVPSDDAVQLCSDKQSLAADFMKMVSDRYEFADVPTQQVQPTAAANPHSVASSNSDKLLPTGDQIQMISDRYEFAEVPDQNSPSGSSIVSSKEKLESPEDDNEEGTTKSKKGYFKLDILDLNSHDGHGFAEAEGNDKKVYINLQAINSDHSSDDLDCEYSHVAHLDTGCTNSYSHINVAETKSKHTHTHSHTDLNSEASHNYSHVNTINGKMLSPGYFHLDTTKIEFSKEVINTKGYSHLEITEACDSDTNHSDGANSQGDHDQGRLAQNFSDKDATKTRWQNQFISQGYSHLEVAETEGLEEGYQQESSRGYSHLDIAAENQTTSGYSHLDVTEIQSISEEPPKINVSKGYSHIDI